MKKIIVLILCITLLSSIPLNINAASGTDIAAKARTYIGYPYVWGKQGPNSFDCSGLVQYVFKQYGINLPASAKAYANYSNYGTKISDRTQLKSGDVLCFSLTSSESNITHVGIYDGNTGEVIHALNTNYGVISQSLEKIWIKQGWKPPYMYGIRIYGVGSSGTNSHTCSGGEYLWDWKAHPHYKCYACATCGKEWADKSQPTKRDGCTECYPQITITIKYNANGGSGAPNSQTYKVIDGANTIITIPAETPSKNGYTFMGWTATSGGTNADFKPGKQYTMNSSKTLYAVWEKEAVDNTCGSNMTWEYYKSSKTLEISGSGYMRDYDVRTRPWEDIKNDVKSIEFEDGIRSIGEKAFKDFEKLEKVELPDSIRTIEENAFSNCADIEVEYNGTEDEFWDIDIEYGNSAIKSDVSFNYYTVQFSNLKGNSVSEQRVRKNRTAKQPSNISKSGYKFEGWYYNNVEYDFDDKVTEDMTIKAKWSKVSDSSSTSSSNDKKTMYSLDGRTIKVKRSDVEAYKKVGWYITPVSIVYAPDGRTYVIAKSDVSAWKKVGWYEYPVASVYAPDGRTYVIAKSDVSAWKKVGWYTYPVTTVYAPDGRSCIVAKSDVSAWKAVGWSTSRY